jgi:hypothetical protein
MYAIQSISVSVQESQSEFRLAFKAAKLRAKVLLPINKKLPHNYVHATFLIMTMQSAISRVIKSK